MDNMTHIIRPNTKHKITLGPKGKADWLAITANFWKSAGLRLGDLRLLKNEAYFNVLLLSKKDPYVLAEPYFLNVSGSSIRETPAKIWNCVGYTLMRGFSCMFMHFEVGLRLIPFGVFRNL